MARKGRPNKEEVLVNRFNDSIFDIKSLLVENYPKSISTIIQIMNDSATKPAAKLTAAKLVKEYTEELFSEIEEEDEEEEDSIQKPVLSIKERMSLKAVA